MPTTPPPSRPATDATLDMGPKLDMDRYVPAYLNVIASKLSSGASRLYLKHFGIGVVEWRIIVHLVAEPWCTAARICQIVGMDKAAASRSYALMEERGLIHFRPAEPRGREAALTPAGRRLHDRVLILALERERRLLADLSPREVDTLINLLGRLLARVPHVNAYDPSPDDLGLPDPAQASVGNADPGHPAPRGPAATADTVASDGDRVPEPAD